VTHSTATTYVKLNTKQHIVQKLREGSCGTDDFLFYASAVRTVPESFWGERLELKLKNQQY